MPVTASPPTHVPHALRLHINGHQVAAGFGEGRGNRAAQIASTWALEYEQSAIGGDDVASFFRSLDDNCVWHLHHLDQVGRRACLYACMHVCFCVF